jgi:hypothetical protein
MYIVRQNPHAVLARRRTLGDLGAAAAPSPGPLASVASALNTQPTTLLLLLGGGMVAGYLVNEWITDARNAARKRQAAARRAARKRAAEWDQRRESAKALWNEHGDKIMPVLLAALVAVGATYYFTTRKSGGAQ